MPENNARAITDSASCHLEKRLGNAQHSTGEQDTGEQDTGEQDTGEGKVQG
jgi:hypothetical protein